ncbi:MAG: hypothetical protein P8011_13250 [Acidihalobacter sp.]|jgi:hypothetical protein
MSSDIAMEATEAVLPDMPAFGESRNCIRIASPMMFVIGLAGPKPGASHG